MHQPLSAALEPVRPVINRNPFEVLASLSANVVEDLFASGQHWPEHLVETAPLVCGAEYPCAQRCRRQLRAGVVDTESVGPVTREDYGKFRIWQQQVNKNLSVLEQLDAPGCAAYDAASGDIRVASVQYPVDVEKQNLTLTHRQCPLSRGHAGAQSAGAARLPAITSNQCENPTGATSGSIIAYPMCQQLTTSRRVGAEHSNDSLPAMGQVAL